MEGDRYDTFEKKEADRTSAACVVVSSVPPAVFPEWDWGKFYPGGTVESESCRWAHGRNETMVLAAMGHPCGYDFIAANFLKKNIQNTDGWTALLRDMKSHPWTIFSSGMRN